MSPPSLPNTTLRPTSDAERLHALDALRGLAILGVLVAYTVWNLGNLPRETWSSADRAVAIGMDLLVDNKFLTIFACLFGVGIAQQWRRWEAAGYEPAPLHLRRMAFLLAVGLLHGIFLRNGDILAPYALLGLVLLGFRHRSTSTIAVAALLLLVTPYLIQGFVAALGLPWPKRPNPSGVSYLEENLAWLRYWYVTNPFISWPRVLALMLAGLLVGRAKLIEHLATSRALTTRVLAVALPLALLTRFTLEGLRIHWTNDSLGLTQNLSLNILYQLSTWTLAAAYAAALLLIAQGASGLRYLWPLRALGRMAFTNYLLQALIVVPFCLAFKLFNRMTPTRGIWLAIGVTSIQVALSTWWLSRYQMGPLERLWRGVTYGSSHVSLHIERLPGS